METGTFKMSQMILKRSSYTLQQSLYRAGRDTQGDCKSDLGGNLAFHRDHYLVMLSLSKHISRLNIATVRRIQ
jgi:hypothetical protein